LQRERALSGGGEHFVEAEHGHFGFIKQSGAAEAGGGEDDGVELAIAEFAKAGVDVAADGIDHEIGAVMEKLGATARRAGADFGAGREVGDGLGFEGDQHIPWIFALGDGAEGEIGLIDERLGDRDVLEGVDGEVDGAFEQGALELLGEDAFAAELVEGLVDDGVAGGLEDDQLDGEVFVFVDFFQGGGDELGLGLGEERAACAEP